MCDTLTIISDGVENPFRLHLLPLSYQNEGLLCALLGLAACHLRSSGTDTSQANVEAAIAYKVAAMQSLSALLSKEEMKGLDDGEEIVTLAIVLLLVLHDVWLLSLLSLAEM